MNITDIDIMLLLKNLIRIPSINPFYRRNDDPEQWFGEMAIARFVAKWLFDRGVDVQLVEVEPNRSNVVARLKGSPNSKRILWGAHLDTVQVAGMNIPPFDPVCQDGRMYGRGAVDDKGCLAAFMLALVELAKNPNDMDITLVATIDEEYRQTGIKKFLSKNKSFHAAIIGEPTELQIVTAAKGCIRWSIDIEGQAAHSSRPKEGINAVDIGCQLAILLREYSEKAFKETFHPLVGSPTMVCTQIDGGEGPNTIPVRCRLTYDRRLIPGEDIDNVLHALGNFIKTTANNNLYNASNISIKEPFLRCPSFETDKTSEIVRSAKTACEAFDLPHEVLGVPFGSDANWTSLTGVPTIIFGPGSIKQAHTADEHIEIKSVLKAIQVISRTTQEFFKSD